MDRTAFTVHGAGRFAHIRKIRQAHNFVIETWANGSEDRDAARTVTQAKAWLADRVGQLRAAGCVVEPA
jgi:L-ribulose-5-phosphate 3-epimerase UlaE